MVTTPGTVTPAIEWPTMTMSPRPASSMSATTESTHSPIVAVARSPGVRPRPGKSTASVRNSGSSTAQFGDDEVPAVAGVLAAVNEDEVRQSHVWPLIGRINWDANTSMSMRKSVKLLLAGSTVIHVTPASA